LRTNQDGNTVRMPVLMQILEEDAEYVLVIEEQKRKRPNAPGTSTRKHFERANQKRWRRGFNWRPPQDRDSHKNDPRSHEARRSRDGHHEDWNLDRLTWTSGMEQLQLSDTMTIAGSFGEGDGSNLGRLGKGRGGS
jgi:hypothetical protein